MAVTKTDRGLTDVNESVAVTGTFYPETQPVSGEGLGVKIFDTATSTYKGLQFNAESPQVCSQDYLFAIAEGDIPGHSRFLMQARCYNITTTTKDVWEGPTDLYVFPATAQKMDVTGGTDDVNTTGTGAWKILIVGLLSDYSSATEEVTLNGATIVTTTKSFLRINYVMVTAAGTLGYAGATINVKGTGTAVVYAVISAGLTLSRQGIYTVPLGKTMYITNARFSCGVGNSTSATKVNFVTTTFQVNVNPATGAKSSLFYPAGELGMVNDTFLFPSLMPFKMPATADLRIRLFGDTSVAVTMMVLIGGWIE